MRLLWRQASVALDHTALHLDGAADGVDHAAELDEAAVPSALNHAAMMHRDGWVDQIAAQRPAVAPESGPRRPRQAANSRRRRTPRSPRAFESRSRRKCRSLITGRRWHGHGCTSMLHGRTWKRSAAPPVDWPVYPRRVEHNTVDEGGNRAEAARRNRVSNRAGRRDDPTAFRRPAKEAAPDTQQKLF